ncbi:MAG TPA: PAS domain-containing sensor histidine kinase [bacterium]|jgi:two-component system sensor histidine kinase ResE
METERAREKGGGAAGPEVWQHLIETSPDIVYVLSPDGVFLDVNPQLCKILKLPRERVIGSKIGAQLDRDHVALAERVLKSIVERRTVERSTRTYHPSGGDAHTFEVVETPLVRDGRVWAVAGIGRDITEDLTLERKLWDTAESRHSAVDFALRTSLGLVKGYVYTLGQSHAMDDVRRARYVHIIEEEIDHLAKIIEDMLDVRRMEIGDHQYDEEIVDVADCVAYAVRQCEEESQRREIRVTVRISERMDPVYTSREGLIRVLLNLVQNAIHHTLHTGEVQVEAQDHEAYVEFIVKDNGTGIPENELPYVFDKYYRAKSSVASPVQGTGLGLTISRTLIEAMGGRVWATSRVGAGSEFRVVLPRRPVETGGAGEGEAEFPGFASLPAKSASTI